MKSWLASNDKRWLLIIDNADNPVIDYSQYIPFNKSGDILFTTRNHQCEFYNTVGSESLEHLEHEHAQQLLLRVAYPNESQRKEKKQAALDVVKILGSHTLAIIQAGAFIKQKFCRLEEYPTFFEEKNGDILKFQSKQHESIYGNVYATFEVSARYLQESNKQENLEAFSLLHTLAFMHFNDVSETIFQRASEYASELKKNWIYNDENVLALPSSHVNRLPEFVPREWSDFQDRLRWRKSLSILESLSIINLQLHDDSATFSMHPLVHAWATERQDHHSRCEAWQSATTIVALSCQATYDYHSFFVVIQSHVRACLNEDIRDYTKFMPDLEAAQILFQIAYALYRVGGYGLLGVFVQRMRSRFQDEINTHPDITIQINVFAGLFYHQEGKFEEAVNIYEEIINDQCTLTARYNSQRLTWQGSLASAYVGIKQVEKAISLLIDILERTPDEYISFRRSVQSQLAHAYQNSGQLDKAIP